MSTFFGRKYPGLFCGKKAPGELSSTRALAMQQNVRAVFYVLHLTVNVEGINVSSQYSLPLLPTW